MEGALKANNNGRLPANDAISHAVHDVHDLVPWVTTIKVKCFLKKMRLSGGTTSSNEQARVVVYEEWQSEMSALTIESMKIPIYCSSNNHDSLLASSTTTTITSTSSSQSPAITMTRSTESSTNIAATIAATTTCLPYGGRPKETNIVASSIISENSKNVLPIRQQNL